MIAQNPILKNMATKLTRKEKGFVTDVADGVVPTIAALDNYDTESYGTAAVIAHENLKKPKIQEALKKMGFDSENAKRVIGEILNNEEAEDKDRLKAGELVLKTNGDLGSDKPQIVTQNQYNFFTSDKVKEKVQAFEQDLIQQLGYGKSPTDN